MDIWRGLPAVVWLGLGLFGCVANVGWADCPQFDGPIQVGTVQSASVIEASGVVRV